MSTKKRQPLKGPLAITLYDTGVWFFTQNNQPVKKMRMFDSTELPGFSWNKIDTQQLQYMSVNGFIDRIELIIKDMLTERQNLMDLIKLIAYGMLYRQFDARMWDIIMDSSLVNMWNRKFTSIPIGFGMNTHDPRINALLKQNASSILKFKQSLFATIQSIIVKKKDYTDEEKNQYLYLAIRYLNMVNPVFWLLLTTYQQHPDAQHLLGDLRNTLEEYIQRSDSPEFLALVVVEMVLVVRNTITKNTTIGQDRPVQISVKFSSKQWKKNEHTKMHITITIGHSEFESLRKQVDEKYNTKLKKKNIEQFFASDVGATDENMGLYYLSYLHDACKEMNISFDSFVNICPTTHQCLMNLVLVF